MQILLNSYCNFSSACFCLWLFPALLRHLKFPLSLSGERDYLSIAAYLEKYSPMPTLTYTLDLEWTIKEDCDSGNVLKWGTEWLANLSEWKPADRNIELSMNKRTTTTNPPKKKTANTRTYIYCIYTCLSPIALLCLDSLNLVIALLRQIMPWPVQVFPLYERDKPSPGHSKSCPVKI